MSPAIRFRGLRKQHLRQALLITVSVIGLAGAASTTRAAEGEFRLMSLNTWQDRFRPNPAERMSDFLLNGNYDVLTFQELRGGSTYLSTIPGLLASQGQGTYTTGQISDLGVASRLEGTHGSYSSGVSISYQDLAAGNGLPETTVGTVHLNYFDDSSRRIAEAKAMNTFADQQTAAGKPVILTGDFNAGDVAERGLHNIEAQIRLIAGVGGNELYRTLAWEYIRQGDEAQLRQTIQEYYPGQNIDGLSWAEWGNALKAAVADGKDTGLRNENYAIAGNTPQTMNILKKNYILLQNESEREGFAPHELSDGSTTWPSEAEDQENVWNSWDRTKIDHFIVSRELGKWYTLADDPNDKYTGVLDETGFANDGTPLSDHEPVAHTMKWMGPALETMTTDEGTKTRLTWGEDAPSFEEQGKVFNLSRNNMRTDLYLGQISDSEGMPTLTWLSDAEKKMLLDCSTSDSRLAAAVAEYCIDDHSFVGETVVTDGGTVAVTEDAAMGGANADLVLANGGLRIDGTEMTTLGRDVVLQDEGGFVQVAAAEADVTATGVISGEGAFAKRGEGLLRLAADNTYTGETLVEGGTLLVNGSNTSSALTTVMAGATLGGIGHVGNLVVSENGTLTPGDLGVGTLFVDGDLTLGGGSMMNFEIGSTGFDMLKVAGDFTALSDFKISFDFLDGLVPAAGDSYQFLSVAGLFDTVLDFASLILPTSDLYAGLAIFGDGAGNFSLGWTDPYQVAPVPLPAPVLALLSALGLLGVFRGRRPKTA